jgi:pimeloyl-ACP methyl ester carboxylesterase
MSHPIGPSQAPTLYAYTGGKAFNPSQPTVLMIHGVLNDHSVWILQSRYLAHHGWNVLAIDLPGHAKSGGLAPNSVEAAAEALINDLELRGIQKVALVGHSFGSLIALEMAARLTARSSGITSGHAQGLAVTHLSMIGTAYPMAVGAALLEAALYEPHKAIAMVNHFSHSNISPPPSTLGPGTWLLGGSAALMRRVLATSSANVFHSGFMACNQYAGGEAAMQAIQPTTIKVLFILGINDLMTPAKKAQSLIHACPRANVHRIPAGHALMSEAPDAVLDALVHFLK